MDEDYICQHLLVKYDIQLVAMPSGQNSLSGLNLK